MTISEAHIVLVTRMGWRDDKTVLQFDLSAENTTADSGRFFQSEHPAVTLENIRDCQPLKEISDDDFNEYLKNLRSDCVQQVLNDVFERDHINENVLTQFPKIFDKAILLRMVINVSELIMTSPRSNKIKRFGDDFIPKLNYDVFRETVTKFANRVHYKYTMGIASRYGYEMESLQRRFGDTRNMLKTITKGQTNEPLGHGGVWDRRNH